MREEEYKIMYEVEDYHWRYVGLRRIMLLFLKNKIDQKNNLLILDAGCGTGENKKLFEKYGTVVGLDNSEIALECCKKKSPGMLIKGSINLLPFKKDVFDLTINVDSLSQRGVNDTQALKEFHRISKKSGTIILIVPAYEWLRSSHDEAGHVKHRYGCKELIYKVRKSGFNVTNGTYWFFLLFPFALFSRLLRKIFDLGKKSDVRQEPQFLNRLLVLPLIFESFFIPSFHFPFGLSITLVAEK